MKGSSQWRDQLDNPKPDQAVADQLAKFLVSTGLKATGWNIEALNISGGCVYNFLHFG